VSAAIDRHFTRAKGFGAALQPRIEPEDENVMKALRG